MYDDFCDNSGFFGLCPISEGLETSESDCVYEKKTGSQHFDSYVICAKLALKISDQYLDSNKMSFSF